VRGDRSLCAEISAYLLCCAALILFLGVTAAVEMLSRGVFIPSRARGAVLAGGSGTLRTGKAAPHLPFEKKGVAASSRIELC